VMGQTLDCYNNNILIPRKFANATNAHLVDSSEEERFQCPVTCRLNIAHRHGPADCSRQRDCWPENSGRHCMSSFVEPAAAIGWRTGGWNGWRSVTSADSMPQNMMVPDCGYTYTSAELSYNKYNN